MGVAGSCWRLYIHPAFGSTPNTPNSEIVTETGLPFNTQSREGQEMNEENILSRLEALEKLVASHDQWIAELVAKQAHEEMLIQMEEEAKAVEEIRAELHKNAEAARKRLKDRGL